MYSSGWETHAQRMFIIDLLFIGQSSAKKTVLQSVILKVIVVEQAYQMNDSLGHYPDCNAF